LLAFIAGDAFVAEEEDWAVGCIDPLESALPHLTTKEKMDNYEQQYMHRV